MKKTLIALAALAATASFAQSSVSIIGTLDLGIKANSAPTSNGASGTVGVSNPNTVQVAQNLTSTSSVKFLGVEDLGGGMKASFVLEFNPTLTNSTLLDQTTTQAATYVGTPFNGEQYLGLSGNFGDVKLGVPNAGFFGVAMMASPLGTAMGSGYGASGVSRLGTAAPGIVSGVGSGTSRIVRHEKTIAYTTPNFAGFTAQVDYALGNDNSTATSGTGNTDTYTGVALKYSKGALNVAYAYANDKFGTNPLAGIYASSTGVLPGNGTTGVNLTSGALAGTDISYHMLSGNYAFGAATVYAGYTNTKHNTSAVTTLEDASSWNIAGKYTMGSIDLLANYLVRTSNLTTANNAKLFGLGADYNLSKRTALTARFELADNNTDSKVVSATAGGSVTNAFGVGIRHTF